MKKGLAWGAALAAATLLAQGCAPLIVGGIAAGTALVVTDRRTTGTQVDDQTIEMRIADELTAGLQGGPVRISIDSFERKVLLTGEVPDEKVKADAGAIAARSLNVRAVVNELTIAAPTTMSQRVSDTTLGGSVRAAFLGTSDIAFNSVKIVTDRGVIYLMGVVTEREGEVAAQVASRVSGVRRVVKVFDYASAEDVQRRRATGSPPPATQPPAPITASPPAAGTR